MKMWMGFENQFNIVNSNISNYWLRCNLQNTHALLEQYSTASINSVKRTHQPQRDKSVPYAWKQKFRDVGRYIPPRAPVYLDTSHLGLHALTLGHLSTAPPSNTQNSGSYWAATYPIGYVGAYPIGYVGSWLLMNLSRWLMLTSV